MGKGAPAPPDPYATAQAQSNANFVNAQQNFGFQNVNEFTPYGSKTYAQSGWNDIYDPSTGKYIKSPSYSSTVTLSPAEQELLNKNTAMRGNIGDIGVSQSERLKGHLGKEMDTSSWQPWKAAAAPGAIRQDQGATDRAAIEAAMMSRYKQQADPRNEAMEAQMAARGMSPGGQGYGEMQKAQGDEFANATRDAYLASGDESRRAQDAYNAATQQKYQLGADWAAQLNNLRQAQATEGFAMRNQPINEIMALLGASGPNTPQFQPFQGSSMQAPNIGQYIYDNYNARAQQSANDMSGLFGIGSSIAGALPWAAWMSDRRTKTDIIPLGDSIAGVPLYKFSYREDPLHGVHIGVMADEAKQLHPDAVHELDGYDHVNYDLLMERDLA
jgi:hypothetical protein